MPATLSDRRASRAVLIGAAGYERMPPLPAVGNNLTRLAGLLTDELRWGLTAGNCRVLANPVTPREVDLALSEAAAGVRRGGLLLVYYAGHGLVGADRQLYLTLPTTDPEALHATAVPYDWVRMRVRTNLADRRLVVLDCCYSGRAEMAGAPGAHTIAERAVIERTCLLVAASADEEAVAPPGAAHTAFTGELLDLLTVGLPRGPTLLDVQTIWEHLVERLTRRGYPKPLLRAGNAGDDLPLIRNPALHSPHRVGQVLYASPHVTGPDLREAVVLVLRYDPDSGALGVVVNRPTRQSVAGVAPDWYDLCSPPPVVFWGGPVSHEGYIALTLLRPGAEPPLPFRTIAGRLGSLGLTTQISVVEDAVADFRLFSGYLGWGPGELESDLSQGVLVPCDEPPDAVFAASPQDLWHYLQRPS